MIKVYLFAFLVASSLVIVVQTSLIEVECEYGDEYFEYFDTNIPLIVCAINDVFVSDNVTKLLIVRDEEESNSITITQSKFHTFPGELFEQISNIRYVNVYRAEMKEIGDFSFVNATSLVYLNIFFNDLTEIRENTFRGISMLKTLTISHNKIKSIHPKAFDMLGTLEFLDLANNLLETFDSETFAPLTKLKHLYLSECLIKSVPVTAFVNNVNLSTLHLDNNNLEKHFKLDIAADYLKGIYLNSNNLTKVTLYAKNPKASIRHVNVNSNEIEMINIDESFNIKVLTLTGNKIKTLDSILPHTTLKFIQLSSNPITDLTNIGKFLNLTRLYLDKTQAILTPDIFASLSNLKSLHLSKMSLTKFDVAWLRGLSNLGLLNLGHNKLEELNYKELVTDLPSLRSIMINENSFNCSYLSEMLEYWKNNTSVRILDADASNTTENVDKITCINANDIDNNSHFLRSFLIMLAVFVGIGLIMIIFANIAKKYEWNITTFMSYRSFSNMTNSSSSRLVNES